MMRIFHWKNIVFLCLLTFSSLTLKAQTLNFEETVKYIQDKFECCETTDIRFIKSITKNGRITFTNGTVYDIFDWVEIEPDFTYHDLEPLDNDVSYVKFVNAKGEFVGEDEYRWSKSELKYTFSQNTAIGQFDTHGDAEKVCNAFKHLKTLCTPEVDPFGN